MFGFCQEVSSIEYLLPLSSCCCWDVDTTLIPSSDGSEEFSRFQKLSTTFSCTFICISHLICPPGEVFTALIPLSDRSAGDSGNLFRWMDIWASCIHNLLKTIALPGRSRGRLFQNPIFVFFELSSIYLFVVLAGLPAQWYHRQTAQGDQKDFQDSQTLATF